MPDGVLDLRALGEADARSAVLAAFETLAVGASFVAVEGRDPKRLRADLDLDHPRGYRFEVLDAAPDATRAADGPSHSGRRVRITRLARTALPRVLCDTTALVAALGQAGSADPGASGGDDSGAVLGGTPGWAGAGAVWKLRMAERGLDSNIINLPAGTVIDTHTGPDLDVLLLVLRGGGQIATELDTVDVRAGDLVWMPRLSQRRFAAGPDGLTYLTVHQRRPPRLFDLSTGTPAGRPAPPRTDH